MAYASAKVAADESVAMVGEDYEDEGFDWCDLESDAPECWILRTFWYRAMRAQAQGKLFEDFFREEELFGLHKPAKATKNMSPAEKMWLEVPDWEKRMEILRNDWVLIAFAVFDIDITDDRRAKYGPVGRRDSVMPESAADNDSSKLVFLMAKCGPLTSWSSRQASKGKR